MTPKPFALSVSALILDEHQQCLMLRRSASSKHYAGTWEPPGGKCDSGEAMEAALLREVEEETGLQVRAHAAPGLIPVGDDRTPDRLPLLRGQGYQRRADEQRGCS